MSEHPDKESVRNAQKRIEPFLDCVAYLLAKRWLRDQRQEEETPSDRQEPSDEKTLP